MRTGGRNRVDFRFGPPERNLWKQRIAVELRRMEFTNTLLLLAQAAVYFTVMVALLQARHTIGIGVFLCALGVMHFLETYLASVFYVQLPFGIISPGSTVLFSGKLLMVLLLYIKEDAAVVRQPIYGLLVGNFMIVALVMILRNHETVAAVPGRRPDISFVDEMGLLMVWGTTLLFLDSIGIILLYERLGTFLRRHIGLRFLICAVVILTFDQLGFYLALRYVSGAPIEVLFGGWAAKMAAALVYSVLFVAYLKLFRDPVPEQEVLPFADVFQVLTYRERYEDLLARMNRDYLTGAFDRRHFETKAPAIVAAALGRGHVVSMLVIDIDHFKRLNDEYGHQAGDGALEIIGNVIATNLRSDDHLFRYGGEEFAVICERLPEEAAVSMADRLRRNIAKVTAEAFPETITVSIGVATAPAEAENLAALFDRADERLYEAKRTGRDRVVGPVPLPRLT